MEESRERLDHLFVQQARWSENAFGPYDGRIRSNGPAAVHGVLKHLKKECDELIQCRKMEDMPLEVADIFILAIEVANMLKLDAEQVCSLVRAKQIINSYRSWNKNVAPGEPIEHH